MKYLAAMSGVWTVLAAAAALNHHWFQAGLEGLIALLFVQLYTERRWP